MAGPIRFEDLFASLGPGAQELQDFSKSLTGLNRNYKAFAKNLDTDAQRIQAGIGVIEASILGLRSQLANTNVGNDQQRKQITELTQQVGPLFYQDSYLLYDLFYLN